MGQGEGSCTKSQGELSLFLAPQTLCPGASCSPSLGLGLLLSAGRRLAGLDWLKHPRCHPGANRATGEVEVICWHLGKTVLEA